jgi:hypothetical protein
MAEWLGRRMFASQALLQSISAEPFELMKNGVAQHEGITNW